MAKQYTSLRNLNFLLHEVHHAADLAQYAHYADYGRETIDMLIDAAKSLADAEMFPYFEEMDHQPVRYENGTVWTHPQLKNIIQKCAEGGWISAPAKVEHGGMQMPDIIYTAANHIFHAANNGALGYIGLTTGAARLITTFGSKTLADTYVPKMFAGEWQGTMALTEPHAGSSLSDITTTAVPQADGSYKIKGQKIYISAGDHLACDNFVHLLLARIQGAPSGTKGISLFVVPKFRPEADGSMPFNDVITAGNYSKLGQKAYTTTHLMFGEQDGCVGYLVGEANKGLSYMFQMMNEARLSVGLMATSTATAAYHASLQYCNERPQGRRLNEKDMTQPMTLIINHPDVRRMLGFQKAVTEGALSLVLECAKLNDLSIVLEGEAKEEAHLLLEILIPIAKTFPSEYGAQAISAGLQTLGGAGYCYDFPLQQYHRDIRIMSIYEGTTGIQSLDLLARKVTMKNGAAAQLYFKTISATIAEAQQHEQLKPYAEALTKELERLQKVTFHLIGIAMQGDNEKFLADATLYMEFFSLVTIGWQWLKQCIVSANSLANGATGDEASFHRSKIQTLRFFFHYEIPKIKGLAARLVETEYLTLPQEEEWLM